LYNSSLLVNTVRFAGLSRAIIFLSLVERKAMKKIIAIAVCVAASSLYAPGVFAQTAAPAPSSAANKPMHKQPRYSVEEQIQRLHKELEITPSQEAQWGQVAQAMRGNAAQMKQMFQAQRGNRESMTAIQLLNNYNTIVQAHADGIKKVTDAFAPL
jgi:hypothetical protein